MPLFRCPDLSDPRLDDYRQLPDPERLRSGGTFIAEGRLVVRTLLTASACRTRSVLVTDAALADLSDIFEPRLEWLQVFVVPPGAIESLTGFDIHRGCLAAGERPAEVEPGQLLDRISDARLLVVTERIGNADNMGGIFRNAAAFGAQAVVIGPGCCDPLYRKAIRVSMGAALRVPFARAGAWPDALLDLRGRGFTLVGLTPRRDAVPIDEIARPEALPGRVAVLVGSEGAGLSAPALAAADVAVRIPMTAGTDSLNAATAAAIALHRLGLRPAGRP